MQVTQLVEQSPLLNAMTHLVAALAIYTIFPLKLSASKMFQL